MAEYYKDIIIKTYVSSGSGSKNLIRARPWPGQGFPEGCNVECSTKMRESQPAGTNFKIRAKITDREGGMPFIYTSYKWRYEVLSDEEATEFIKQYF